MTFADELRHAVSVEPVLHPLPEPAQEAGEAAWEEYRWSRTPQPRVTAVRVLGFLEGLSELVAAGMAKVPPLYERPAWTNMALPGTTPEAQWVSLVERRAQPHYENVAIWTQGTYYRVLIRESSTQVFSLFTLGSGTTWENRQELYRALWDCGVERFYGWMRQDHAHLQTVRREVPGLVEESHPWHPESVTLVYPVNATRERP